MQYTVKSWRLFNALLSEEDDMDFHEAAESAVAKRKFLLNILMKKKSLPDESDDDKEEENDILGTETWISHVTFLYIFCHYL